VKQDAPGNACQHRAYVCGNGGVTRTAFGADAPTALIGLPQSRKWLAPKK
jgi:hypothetical protein